MMNYKTQDLVRLAKRYNNTKRSYLLVNPLQGKHMPVSPAASLSMMDVLGNRLCRHFPDARLVIGFAETATAIGAVAASRISESCVYIHTTREEAARVENWLCFREEHSHAVEQRLCGDHLRAWIEATPQVVFVDDELSTGKTLINIITQLRRAFPELAGKQLAAASILNRMSPEHEARLLEAGAVCEYLLKLPAGEDYSARVAQFETEAASDCRGRDLPLVKVERGQFHLASDSPRTGVLTGAYLRACRAMAERAMPWLRARLRPGGQVLVLGTEEFMYPALVLAKTLEELEETASVSFHATTRSPIAICKRPDYPIFNGFRLDSFYETDRDTYIYDLRPYDTAVVLTDGLANMENALRTLTAALYRSGCSHLLFLSGGHNV